MPHAITCEIIPEAVSKLKQLRLKHLEYIHAHQGEILFGGPTRSGNNAPETMIIVVKTDDRASAESFIAGEPYNASGEVFAQVKVRPWSQVIPPLSEHALDDAIASERREQA